MKKLLVALSAFLILSFISADKSISKKERKFAAKLLADTEKGVFDAVAGLSDTQLKYKPAPDKWSVEECLKHIAITESSLWQMTEGAIKKPANPEERAEIKTTDEELIQRIENRTQKVKTSEALQPENTPYKSASDALESFKMSREKIIEYVKTTDEDLRNHVTALRLGKVDSYQMILFIAGHSNRHTQQIDEVKADPNFPKN